MTMTTDDHRLNMTTDDHCLNMTTDDHFLNMTTDDHRLNMTTDDHRLNMTTDDHRLNITTDDHRLTTSGTATPVTLVIPDHSWQLEGKLSMWNWVYNQHILWADNTTCGLVIPCVGL